MAILVNIMLVTFIQENHEESISIIQKHAHQGVLNPSMYDP